MGAQDATGSFDDFYQATSKRVVRTTYALTGDLEEARDCTQEAYERAWKRWGFVERHADPEAWVRSTAHRLAISRWRRSRVAIRKLHLLRTADSVPAPSDDRVVIAAILQQLVRGQREAIVLHHLCGLSVEEVAAECGIPVSTAKARLRRGRQAMARLLTDDNALPDAGGSTGRSQHAI